MSIYDILDNPTVFIAKIIEYELREVNFGALPRELMTH